MCTKPSLQRILDTLFQTEERNKHDQETPQKKTNEAIITEK